MKGWPVTSLVPSLSTYGTPYSNKLMLGTDKLGWDQAPK